ncbi:Excalibur domain-containing protein [Mycobacteroides abscessus subsp. massiliense]|uniref:excalibur calcium-binding domain-containing protein n=1 Tax=Mycobacteroides abscessus TaxID=36809 RepID=UPI0009A6D794|nr:excalibur calcium-binding domain-containing protein [Mycobacteroides abscessus]SKD37036.1 Excalibur domain-containing protein [Mycobacteroides abscessus subsp. massiliense]SKD37175.1 Excalibur domain-containing protein [Mycobacteroides abscessus subsp. massiliense]SKD46495.1 Excalibur domain-containing protein [Mycobacteroides abscessus subsp. massiliense]SKD49010.1 Excalibur domain-containing protein [Mycobacteroides abscessus subsp. massiliense]SKD58116.1 Excalibur domain-containing prote
MKLTVGAVISGLIGGMVIAASAAWPASAAAPTLADPPYGSCKEAHADGAYNIKKGDPGYRPGLDRDHDGVACEG